MVHRLVDCIPRAPLCVAVHSLNNIFIRDDALVPLVLESPWTSGASTEEVSSRHASLAAARGSSSAATSAGQQPAGRLRGLSPQAESDARRRYVWGRYTSILDWVLNLAGAVELPLEEELRVKDMRERSRRAGVSTTTTDGFPDVNAFGLYVSFDREFVTVATSATAAGRSFARLYSPPLSEREQKELNRQLAALPGSLHGFCDADLCYPSRFTEGPHVLAACDALADARLRVLEERCLVVANAFRRPKGYEVPCGVHMRLAYFGDDFVPPPPPSVVRLVGRPHAGAGPAPTSFTPHALAAMLPTHFVPMSMFLRMLPLGYTEAHVRGALSATNALQVVEVGHTPYVRFYGGEDGMGFVNPDGDSVVPDPMAVLEEGEDEDRVGDGAGGRDAGGGVSAAGSAESVQRLMAGYEPDPFLAHAFLPHFQGAYRWTSLYDVVGKAPTAVQAALMPLREHATLLFFAQLQQHFLFTPERGGGLCRAYPPVRSLTFSSSPLSREACEVNLLLMGRNLVFVSDVEGDTGGGLAHQLSSRTKRRIIAHFGTMRRFLYQHESIFVLSIVPRERGFGASTRGPEAAVSSTSNAPACDAASAAAAEHGGEKAEDTTSSRASANPLAMPPPPVVPSRRGAGFAIEAPPPTLSSLCGDGDDGGEAESSALTGLDETGFPRWLSSPDLAVMTTHAAKRMLRRARTDEEMLEHAVASRNHLHIRKYRRRLAVAVDPGSPYLDRDVLLDTVARYIPTGKHISVRALLNTLPSRLADYIPDKTVRWLCSKPDKVTVFEYRYPSNLRIMRAGAPLPEGHLRSSYTEAEIVYLVAALLPPGEFVTAATLSRRLPHGARQTIEKKYRHLVDLLEGYPQHFVVAHQAGGVAQKNQARLQLVSPPPQPTTMNADDVKRATHPGLSAEEHQAAVERDQAMLVAEVPDSLIAPPEGKEGDRAARQSAAPSPHSLS